MNWQARLTNWQIVEAVREFIVKMHDSMILFWKRILSSSIKRTKVYIVETSRVRTMPLKNFSILLVIIRSPIIIRSSTLYISGKNAMPRSKVYLASKRFHLIFFCCSSSNIIETQLNISNLYQTTTNSYRTAIERLSNNYRTDIEMIFNSYKQFLNNYRIK